MSQTLTATQALIGERIFKAIIMSSILIGVISLTNSNGNSFSYWFLASIAGSLILTGVVGSFSEGANSEKTYYLIMVSLSGVILLSIALTFIAFTPGEYEIQSIFWKALLMSFPLAIGCWITGLSSFIALRITRLNNRKWRPSYFLLLGALTLPMGTIIRLFIYSA